MLLISDTNIVYSAVIKPTGTISKIIFSKRKFKIIAPDFLKSEINKHKKKLMLYSGYSEKQFNSILKELYANIDFIDTKVIPKIYTNKAYELVKDIDLDDLEFVELALYKKCYLWTTDDPLSKGLKAKGFTKVITTAEIKAFLYKK